MASRMSPPHNVNAFSVIGRVLGMGGSLASRFQRRVIGSSRRKSAAPKRIAQPKSGSRMQASMRSRGVGSVRKAKVGRVKKGFHFSYPAGTHYKGVTSSGRSTRTHKYSHLNVSGGSTVSYGKPSKGSHVRYRGKKYRSGPFTKKASVPRGRVKSVKAPRRSTGMVTAHSRRSIKGKMFKVRQHRRKR